jgi:peroxin-1
LGVHLKPPNNEGVYVGWTGLASASSLGWAASNSTAKGEVGETVELDPQYARVLGSGFAEGDIVSSFLNGSCF